MPPVICTEVFMGTLRYAVFPLKYSGHCLSVISENPHPLETRLLVVEGLACPGAGAGQEGALEDRRAVGSCEALLQMALAKMGMLTLQMRKGRL